MSLRHVLPCLAVLFLAGCGSKSDEDAPETYAIKGHVKFRDGKPYPGGSIELRPINQDEQYRMTGRIDKSGAFTLTTVGGKKPIEGGMAGDFKVMLIPEQGQDQTAVALKPMLLQKSYKIEARDDFELNITLDQASPR